MEPFHKLDGNDIHPHETFPGAGSGRGPGQFINPYAQGYAQLNIPSSGAAQAALYAQHLHQQHPPHQHLHNSLLPNIPYGYGGHPQPQQHQQVHLYQADAQHPQAHQRFLPNAPLELQTKLAHFSPSTQDILRRVGTRGAVAQGSPEWAAARQEVQRVVGNAGMGQGPGQAQGLGPGPGPFSPTHATHAGQVTKARRTSSAASPRTPTSAGGRRGGARPRSGKRGKGKGRKRKRDEDDDEDDGLELSSDEGEDAKSDVSESALPQTTVTKSGRSVHKPSQFNPAADVTASAQKRKKGRKTDVIVCVKCGRAHSAPLNVIVLCDGCDAPWHQWCHWPNIEMDVVVQENMPWFCGSCEHQKEVEAVPLESRVSGEKMSREEKLAYLTTLPQPTLANLLLHATTLYPDLRVFAPPTPQKPSKIITIPHKPPKTTSHTQTLGHTIKLDTKGPSKPIDTRAASAGATSSSSLQSETHNFVPHSTAPTFRGPTSAPTFRAPAPSAPPTATATDADAEVDSDTTSTHGTLVATVNAAIDADADGEPDSSSPRSPPRHSPTPGPYPDYTPTLPDSRPDVPPQTYPLPGQGGIKPRPVTEEGMKPGYMLDDNWEAFQHFVRDARGNLRPVRAGGGIKALKTWGKGDLVSGSGGDADGGCEKDEDGDGEDVDGKEADVGQDEKHADEENREDGDERQDEQQEQEEAADDEIIVEELQQRAVGSRLH